jgi:carboxymethylenebutenolidase
MLHEWWGLNAETVAMADQLAADGYVVLAPDLFRGRVSVSRPGAVLQMLLTPGEQVADDVDRALAQLRAMPTVDPRRVGVVGFCFGGTQAMYLGSRTTELGATAIFYGGGPITADDQIGELGARGPVVGIYGGEDSTISVEDVRRFEELVRERGRETFFTVYPDVGHAFVDPRSLHRGGEAAEAWDQFRVLFQQHL